MTLKTFKQQKHTFLVIQYEKFGFLINQNQFSSSVYFESIATIKSPSKYLSSIIRYNNMNLIAFDLDAMLKDTYRYEDMSVLKMALVVDAQVLSMNTQKLLAKIQFRGKQSIAKDFVAFKIAVQSEMKEINLAEIRLLPPSLKEKQSAEGIIGCRFNSEDKIQYLIDIDTLFFNSIKRKN